VFASVHGLHGRGRDVDDGLGLHDGLVGHVTVGRERGEEEECACVCEWKEKKW
jgi:hypothetical protein